MISHIIENQKFKDTIFDSLNSSIFWLNSVLPVFLTCRICLTYTLQLQAVRVACIKFWNSKLSYFSNALSWKSPKECLQGAFSHPPLDITSQTKSPPYRIKIFTGMKFCHFDLWQIHKPYIPVCHDVFTNFWCDSITYTFQLPLQKLLLLEPTKFIYSETFG